MPNAYALEKQLHEANKEHRLNGEWFRESVDFCDVEFSYADRNILKNKDFFFMFQREHLDKLTKNSELSGADFRVLFFLFRSLDFDNYIHVTQKDISIATNIKQQNVSSALTKLTKLSIIEKMSQGRTKAYRLNPSYAWKGKISEFQKDEKERKKRAVSEAKIVQIKPKATTENEPPPSD